MLLRLLFYPPYAVGQLFAYPVSLVLRFWHWLLADVIHLAGSATWVASILLLVATVRGALAPLAYRSQRSGRILVLLRPRMRAMSRRYRYYGDPDAAKYLRWGREELKRANGVAPRAGCVMPLVQVPVILGLYRLVREMAFGVGGDRRPHPVKFIPAEDVAGFAASSFRGVPLPAYPAMPEPGLVQLGVTRTAVLELALPLILLATVLTTANMSWSVHRMRRTMDRESRFARTMLPTMVVLACLGATFPLLFGLFGPAPVAVMLYWVANNLWTSTQSAVLVLAVDRRLPLTGEFRDYAAKVRAERKAVRRAGPEIAAAAARAEQQRRLKVARMRAMVVWLRPAEQHRIPGPGPAEGTWPLVLELPRPPGEPVRRVAANAAPPRWPLSGPNTPNPGPDPGRSAEG